MNLVYTLCQALSDFFLSQNLSQDYNAAAPKLNLQVLDAIQHSFELFLPVERYDFWSLLVEFQQSSLKIWLHAYRFSFHQNYSVSVAVAPRLGQSSI